MTGWLMMLAIFGEMCIQVSEGWLLKQSRVMDISNDDKDVVAFVLLNNA